MKLKRILPALLLSCAFLTAQAQDLHRITDNDNATDDPAYNFGGRKDSTKVKDKIVPKGLSVWTVDERFGDRTSCTPDTASYMFMNTIFTSGLRGEYNTTGNLGAPRYNRIFIDNPTAGQFLFTQPYSFFNKPVGQFLFTGDNARGKVVLPYAILGIIVLIIAVVFSCVRLPEINYKATNEDSEQGTRIVKLFRHHPMFVFGLFSLLAYEVAEISINSYFINFVTAKGWMTDNTASIVLTAALAFFMLGRFGGSWIMRTVKAETMLLACATGSVISIGLVLCNLGKLSMIALICNYIFEAIMFPTIFSLSLRGLGNLTKSASSLLMMTPIGGCGFLLMSIVAESTQMMSLPFIIPFLCFFLVLLFALELARKGKGHDPVLTL